MDEYTDEQKWFLVTTELDGTLLCDIFYREFEVDMTEEKNEQLFKEIEKFHLKPNAQGWLKSYTSKEYKKILKKIKRTLNV